MNRTFALPFMLWALTAPALLAILLAQDETNLTACDHGSSGATKPVDLSSIIRAHEKAKNLLRFKLDVANPSAGTQGADLPACTRATQRIIELPFPVKSAVGTTIHFLAPQDISSHTKTRKSAVVIVSRGTITDSVQLVHAAGINPDNGIYLGSREMFEAFGVDCTPTTLTFKDATHAELQVRVR